MSSEVPGPPFRARTTSIEVPQPAPDPPADGEDGEHGDDQSRRLDGAAGPRPPGGGAGADVAPPRLARYALQLASGREVGLAVCGHGTPLVVVHGFGGEGILYAQTLSRLVRMGFRVIAIDAPGHGRTASIPLWSGFDRYASLVTETLEHLGIERAVFVGHSMGGRVVSELAAAEPSRVIALVLIDAIVGEVWDRFVDAFRVAPGLYAAFGVGLLVDTASTVPVLNNPRQAAKLVRLLTPTGAGHVLRPWRMAGPMLTILKAGRSADVLARIADQGLPTFFVNGDRDVLVPLCNARRAAVRSAATLVTVHGARHSWLLADPETFPALLGDLLDGALGEAIAHAVWQEQEDAVPLPGARRWALREDAWVSAESAFYRRGAPVFALTPDATPVPLHRRHRRPRYRWTITPPAAPGSGD